MVGYQIERSADGIRIHQTGYVNGKVDLRCSERLEWRLQLKGKGPGPGEGEKGG